MKKQKVERKTQLQKLKEEIWRIESENKERKSTQEKEENRKWNDVTITKKRQTVNKRTYKRCSKE